MSNSIGRNPTRDSENVLIPHVILPQYTNIIYFIQVYLKLSIEEKIIQPEPRFSDLTFESEFQC